MTIKPKMLTAALLFGFASAILIAIFLEDRIQSFEIGQKMENIAKKAKDFIYYEATIHNPKGDLVPDSIDDSIISKIRNNF